LDEMEKFVRLNQYQRRIGYLLLMVAREVNGDARVTNELQLVKVNEVGLLKVKGLGLNYNLCFCSTFLKKWIKWI